MQELSVKGKRIYAGLSGGVDSAVAATLLKRAGANVTGVFIKGWYPPGLPCTWAQDRRDAMRVAAHLHIPFITLDAAEAYKRDVIEYLIRSYAQGQTPNPDIMCNKAIKFGIFHTYAKAHGADAIATGHYLTGPKDQRYFLWAVEPEVLRESVFPLDGWTKEQVRAYARRAHIPVAAKPDSQGVCFLGDISIEDFLRDQMPVTPGTAVDETGTTVGEHEGALQYTLGQRVRLLDAPPGPWYVVRKDIHANELTVAHNIPEQARKAASGVLFRDAVWHSEPENVTSAQLRYRGPFVPGVISGNSFHPEQTLPELAAPGQSIVFYTGEELAGGGIIEQ